MSVRSDRGLMALIDASQFYKDLEKGIVRPLYYFYGEEPYLIQQAVQRLLWRVLSDGQQDFNFHSFYAGDVEIERVRDEVETLPMMASHRVVVLRDCQNLSDNEWKYLEGLFSHPVESTIFILVATRVEKKAKAAKILADKSVCIEFKKPYENQIPSWIKYIAGTLSIDISNEAIFLIHRLVGSHLIEIESELKKLSEYVGSQRRIELADVATVVTRSREENVFDLTKAIGESDRILAIEHLVHLLDQGQSETGIVALVARHIRILLLIKRGLDEGLNGARLAHYAQVPPYFLDNYIEQARRWTVRKLENTLSVLAETDRALKSSPLSAHIWLENMVLQACSRI